MSVIVLPFLLVWGIIVLSAVSTILKSKKSARPKSTPAAEKPERVRRPSNAGEGHVATIGPDIQSKLEQLETLKNAGLLDQEEYNEKKRKILRG